MFDGASQWAEEAKAETYDLLRQIQNPLCVRVSRRVFTVAARSRSRGMTTCTYVDLEAGRFAIMGLLPLVAVVLAEWDSSVKRYYFGKEDSVDAASSEEDQAFGALSPLVKTHNDQRIVAQVCADDDLIEPSKPRIKRLRRLAEEQGAELALFNVESYRAKKQRFQNCVILNNLSQKAAPGQYNFFREQAAILKRCKDNPRVCLSELQELPHLDVAKVQAIAARMIQKGELALVGRGDQLNQKPFTPVTPLEWREDMASSHLRIVSDSR